MRLHTMIPGSLEEIRSVFRHLHESGELPHFADLTLLLNTVLRTLNNESPLIRPRASSGSLGGLLLLDPHITTVIVPDLHARTGYMTSLIDMDISGLPLLERLSEGSLQVICVGDGFHSEMLSEARWHRALNEYQHGFRRHQNMDEEMGEGLSLMAMVMILKIVFPEHFHFLKGNHENVTNTDGGGNRPFVKYVLEGQMVKDWFLKFPGATMLKIWSEFEQALPLLAVGNHFLVSHAEPRRFYPGERVIRYHGDDALIFDFTWTGNGEAEEGSVKCMLKHYLGVDADESLYFGGHRPVRGLFYLRSNNRYVQFHNPEYYNVTVLESGRPPDPLRDIRTIQ